MQILTMTSWMDEMIKITSGATVGRQLREGHVVACCSAAAEPQRGRGGGSLEALERQAYVGVVGRGEDGRALAYKVNRKKKESRLSFSSWRRQSCNG